MSRVVQGIVAIVILLGMSLTAMAQQSSRVKAGMLRCQTSASLGLVVGSHQKLRCRFDPGSGGPSEAYSGHINRLGLDVGITGKGVLAWAVFAPSAGVQHGALSGKYVGASGEVSLGLGVGANALIGGSQRSIALQPLSVEGQVGVNLAMGVAGLGLRSTQ